MSATRAAALIDTGAIVVSIVFPVLSLVSITLRWYARHKSRQQFKWDDWWIVGAWVLSLSVSIIAWVFAGIAGISYYKVPTQYGNEKSSECIQLSSSMYILAVAAVKISVLLFYKRIFTTRNFAIAVWIGIAVVSAWGIVFFIMTLASSNPIDAAWTGKGYARYDVGKLGYGSLGSSIGLDVIILSYPIPMLHKLQMPLIRKIQVTGVLFLGSFAIVCSICRFIFLSRSIETVVHSPGYDAIHDLALNYVFLIIEPYSSIIAACLPCYPPLFPRGRSAQSIINSIKSSVSLNSRKSNASSNSTLPGSIVATSETRSQIENEPETLRTSNSVGQIFTPASEELRS